MSTMQDSWDLASLEDTYTIVGELSARENVQAFLANRREDGADVRILVESAPPGDQGNALSHFAADANLLATLEHRNLVPILDARWVGDATFAVVTPRIAAPTIETLIAKGESFSYPRIATILHEVNGLLEWAREQKVVHRTLTLDTIHLEPGSDRVLVSFVAEPLTRMGPPGEDGDSRTIARLAWALITRGRELPRAPEDSIAVVRPELPRRVVEATDAMLSPTRVGAPSALDYIGLVAMTDVLAQGEKDAAELQAVVHHEQVLEREAWAAKEREYQEQAAERERQIEAERAELERTLADERQKLNAERADLEAQVAAEREQIAADRAQLEAEIAAEREKLAMDRTAQEQAVALERATMAATIAEEREANARTIAEEREANARTIAAERAGMERTIAEERAAVEATLAAEHAKLSGEHTSVMHQLASERAAAEEKLAAARAEFEATMEAQRREFEARMAAEREEFHRTVLEERATMEAEKEGLAVFHAAEREQIAAERRALEEAYRAYDAEVVYHDEDERDDDERDDDEPDRAGATRVAATARRPVEREVRASPAFFVPFELIAVSEPVTETVADDDEPAETETGLTRRDASRSRRASWGVPVAILGLAGSLTAAALGLGMGNDDHEEELRSADRAATEAAPRAAAAEPATVVDSAGGSIAPADSLQFAQPYITSEGTQRQRPTSLPAARRELPRSLPRRFAPPQQQQQIVPPSESASADSAGAASADSMPRLTAPVLNTPVINVPPQAPRRDSVRPVMPFTFGLPVQPPVRRDSAPRPTRPDTLPRSSQA